ncbi:LOW QUALITY PROTEIN: prostacyclin receptor-like [Lethenteron reissneri]|uniref:LOW QUALITY PROTEIN: prostacyclin receptor-like n=1 Tax=Lethenteron reissneri TaxID=7753 RepID=UPI002AB63FA2|nr:LOW QUALITY PROTEIN: prostacyclin receptor-like [Lethenteron reissneri]
MHTPGTAERRTQQRCLLHGPVRGDERHHRHKHHHHHHQHRTTTTITTAATSNASSCDAVPDAAAALPAALMFAVGVLGNALAVTILACSRRDSKQTVFFALVCALTVTDLLSTCLSSPLVLAAYGAQKTIEQLGGNPLCVYFTFCMLFFGFATMGILCTMAVERWLSIAHPYVYQRRVSQTWARVALAIVLVVSAALLRAAAGRRGGARAHVPAVHLVLRGREARARLRLRLRRGHVAAHRRRGGVQRGRRGRALSHEEEANAAGRGAQLPARLGESFGAACRSSTALAPPPLPSSSSSQPGRDSPLASLRRKISVQRLQRIHRPRGVEVDNLVLLVFMTIIFLVCSLPLTVSTLINAIWPTNTEFKRDLAGLRFASFNPILDPWIFIIVRRSVLERLLSVPARLRAALLPHRAGGDSRGSGLLRHLGKGKGGGGGGGSSESASLSSFQLAQLIRSADASPMMVGRLAEMLGRGGEPGAPDSVRSSLDLELPDGKFSELLSLSRSRREAET